jgi:DNA (cytosine-5)-methyltransferase 1
MNGNSYAADMRERYNENGYTEQHIEISNREEANAITTVQKDSMVTNGLRIRKLTPKECWRLMGFDDEDCEKVAKVNSNTQLYKQAGNSIVVNVLEAIFKNLFKE